MNKIKGAQVTYSEIKNNATNTQLLLPRKFLCVICIFAQRTQFYPAFLEKCVVYLETLQIALDIFSLSENVFCMQDFQLFLLLKPLLNGQIPFFLEVSSLYWYPAGLETFQIVWKVSSLSEEFWVFLESFQIKLKIFSQSGSLSGNITDFLKTFYFLVFLEAFKI